MRTCSVQGCDRRHYGHGLCNAHYKQRWRAEGAARQCSIEGCEEPHDSHGWCIGHYLRWKRHGDPLGGSRLREPFTEQPPPGCGLIPLYGQDGKVRACAVVDQADYERLGHHTWSLSLGYAIRFTGVKTVRLHRELLGLSAGDPEVDHVDGDPLNNRRSNLRLCPRGPAENQQNHVRLHPRNTSGYRGVTRESGKWRAQAVLNGRRHDLGLFSEVTEAAAAASRFRAEHMPFSEDAREQRLDELSRRAS